MICGVCVFKGGITVMYGLCVFKGDITVVCGLFFFLKETLL